MDIKQSEEEVANKRASFAKSSFFSPRCRQDIGICVDIPSYLSYHKKLVEHISYDIRKDK